MSCEIFSAGYTLDEELCEGVRRGDVCNVRDAAGLASISLPRVDPVKVETISPRVNLLFADWELLMFIRKPLVMFLGCLERPNGPKGLVLFLRRRNSSSHFFCRNLRMGWDGEVLRHFAGPSDNLFLNAAFSRTAGSLPSRWA